MSKDKMKSMLRYRNEIKSRLDSGTIPSRRLGKEAAYKEFLTKELRVANKKLEDLALANPKK